MAVSLLTHYGGSVSFGSSNGVVKRSGQRYVKMAPTFGAAELRLPVAQNLGGSGLYYIVQNEGLADVNIVNNSLSQVGTVEQDKVAFVFYIEDPDGISGSWIVVGAGNWSEGGQGGEGDISINYGSVGEPTGTRLDFGSVQMETSPVNLALGGRVLSATPAVWS